MKHIIHLLLAFFCALGASSLNLPQPQQQDKNREEVNQRLFEAKATEICERLMLTADQKSKFVPLYRKYDREMRQVWQKNREQSKPLNNVERTKMHIKCQQKVQDIRLKYVDKFSKILTGNQLDEFYRIETEMQQRIKHRKNGKPGGNSPGKRKPEQH